jgi:hypothetical protein
MHHSLRRSGLETHVRIVAISLVAGIAVVIGALNMKSDSRGARHEAWTNGGVIKASQQAVYSASKRPFVR